MKFYFGLVGLTLSSTWRSTIILGVSTLRLRIARKHDNGAPLNRYKTKHLVIEHLRIKGPLFKLDKFLVI